MRKARFLSVLFFFMVITGNAHSFCGFYVAQAGAKLFNKTSQVIIARKDNKNVITMANDFSGDVKDFAIVVPVPVVLEKKDVRIAENALFDAYDKYSAPRVVEYFDREPCETQTYVDGMAVVGIETTSERKKSIPAKPKNGVTIEAQYSVGEYDILILSAKDSGGLVKWLTANKYSLPEKAKEVLQPYIKNNLKFFVVKVDLGKFEKGGFTKLRPLQIEYTYDKFMLPIRLGMANANGDQDLVIYCLSDVGRIETVNYRTAKIPSNQNVPMKVKTNFAPFYQNVFNHNWAKEGKNAAMLEYFWDISGFQPVKCDPCPAPVLTYEQLAKGGAYWLKTRDNYGYEGPLYFTRLHVRYNRELYPQDLMFQVVPSKENFQGRYVVNNPATGSMDCEAGKAYLENLKKRQQEEWDNYYALTGEKRQSDGGGSKNEIPFFSFGDSDGGSKTPLFILALVGVIASLWGLDKFLKRISPKRTAA